MIRRPLVLARALRLCGALSAIAMAALIALAAADFLVFHHAVSAACRDLVLIMIGITSHLCVEWVIRRSTCADSSRLIE